MTRNSNIFKRYIKNKLDLPQYGRSKEKLLKKLTSVKIRLTENKVILHGCRFFFCATEHK